MALPDFCRSLEKVLELSKENTLNDRLFKIQE